MKIMQLEHSYLLIYIIEGRLDTHGAAMLGTILRNVAAEGQLHIILDMQKVNYINSEAMHTLAEIQMLNQKNGGDLRVVARSEQVNRIFTIAGYHQHFPDYPTIRAATCGL